MVISEHKFEVISAEISEIIKEEEFTKLNKEEIRGKIKISNNYNPKDFVKLIKKF